MSSRRATNLSLDPVLLAEARALKINLSRAASDGIGRAVTKQRAERWAQDNAEAIANWNEHVSKHGVPLARHRQF
jgi:antitoxin CcdA